MRGKNVRFRLEPPIDTKTATGGRTRQWPNLPELSGAFAPLSAVERTAWERETSTASFRLTVMGRAIPEQHRDKVDPKNRVVIINRRNILPETVYDIVGVKPYHRTGRLYMFEIILEKVE